MQLWLGGLSPGVLECCAGSVFALDSSEGDRLLLRGRTGLSAKAQVLERFDRTNRQLTAGEGVRKKFGYCPETSV